MRVQQLVAVVAFANWCRCCEVVVLAMAPIEWPTVS